jgi:excisionase family DNA binding protein
MVARSTTSPEILLIDAREAAVPTALNVKQVAAMLGVSVRHVYRMTDGGLMPRPIKLGGLNRWSRKEIEDWFQAGARPIR